jgi:hypothetical protein
MPTPTKHTDRHYNRNTHKFAIKSRGKATTTAHSCCAAHSPPTGAHSPISSSVRTTGAAWLRHAVMSSVNPPGPRMLHAAGFAALGSDPSIVIIILSATSPPPPQCSSVLKRGTSAASVAAGDMGEEVAFTVCRPPAGDPGAATTCSRSGDEREGVDAPRAEAVRVSDVEDPGCPRRGDPAPSVTGSREEESVMSFSTTLQHHLAVGTAKVQQTTKPVKRP